MKTIPENHIAELKQYSLNYFSRLGKNINTVHDHYDSHDVSDGTEYDINFYSDREYGSGETDGYNATAYALKLDIRGDVTTDTDVSAQLLDKWIPV